MTFTEFIKFIKKHYLAELKEMRELGWHIESSPYRQWLVIQGLSDRLQNEFVGKYLPSSSKGEK